MIETKEHRSDLLQIARRLQKKSQSCPTNENGEPTETYLEYISMMFEPEVAKIAKFLTIFPVSTSVNKLSKETGTEKNEIHQTLEEASKRGLI